MATGRGQSTVRAVSRVLSRAYRQVQVVKLYLRFEILESIFFPPLNGDRSFPEHFLDTRDFVVFKNDPAMEGKFSSTTGVVPAELSNGDHVQTS